MDTTLAEALQRIARLESSAFRGPEPVKELAGASRFTEPFWDSISIVLADPTYLTDSIAVSSSWESLFTDSQASYRKFRIPTIDGSFTFSDAGFRGCSWHRLRWISELSYDAPFWVHLGPAGDPDEGSVQIHMNGAITGVSPFSASDMTFPVRRGPNELIVARDAFPDSIQVTGTLFTPETLRKYDGLYH